MKAMILAAGSASRLYPLTYTLPMVLVPVVNRPIIEHQLEYLARYGFNEVCINLHYLHRSIREHLGDGSRWGVKIRYSHEDELRGTAGGVAYCRDFFDDTFLVIGGDLVTDLPLDRFLEFHRRKKATASLALYRGTLNDEVGMVKLNEDDRVVSFLEKPRQKPQGYDWDNAGIYLFEPAVFDHIPDVVPFDFGKDLFPEWVAQKGEVFGFRAHGFWADIEDPHEYRQAHWDVLSHRTGITPPGEETAPQIFVGKGAEIDSSAVLRPPLVLGDGVRVGAGARLEGPLVLGHQVTVEARAHLRSSIIWSHTHVGGGVEVENSLIGSDCELRPGREYSGVVIASGARFWEKKVSLD